MGALDEVSRTIGKIEGDIKGLQDGQANTHVLLREVSEKLDALHGLPDRVTRMEPEVDSYRKMRQRGIGIGFALTTAGALVGAKFDYLSTLISKKLGN